MSVYVFKNKIFILFIFLLMVIYVEGGNDDKKACIEKSLDKFSVCQTVTSLEIDAKNKEEAYILILCVKSSS